MRAQYFNVTLTQCDYKNVIPTGMVRLIASDLVFFFNLEDFKNSDAFLESLSSGDELVICAEIFNDGSYWLKWAYHKTKGWIEPDRNVSFHRGLIKEFLWAFGLSAFAVLAYFCFIYSDDNMLLIVLGAFASCAALVGFSMVTLFLKTIWDIVSPRRKSILKALDQVIAGQYQISHENPKLISLSGIKNPKMKPIKPQFVNELKIAEGEFQSTQGKVNLFGIQQYTVIGYKGAQTVFNANLLQIDGEPFSVVTPENEPLFNNHSLFIAQGDQIEIIHKKLNETDTVEMVFGVFNQQDHLAYTLSNGGSPQERSFYKGLWIFTAALIALFAIALLVMNITEVIERGNHWDYWDWLYILDNGVGFISFASSITLGISFLTGLCVAIYFYVSKRGRMNFIAQRYLSYLRQKSGQSDYVTEVRT